MALDRAGASGLTDAHPSLRHISPLSSRLDRWRHALASHPDKAFPSYLLDGLQHGFRVGYAAKTPLRPVQGNLPSASLHPEVIDTYIADEVREGRMLGPFRPGQIPNLHVNRMGVVPKGHSPGRFRLITDLSFPEGASLNDGISSELCSLRYTSVEEVAAMAQRLGQGTLLAKLDIRSAYWLVPVNPADRQLLGVEWRGSLFVDRSLPFGLRSAPKVFTAVADALQWVMLPSGVTIVEHYFDDFVTLGSPKQPECGQNLDKILVVCAELGVPLAMDKLEGPTDRLTFLGIELDTRAGVLRLPTDKLSRIKELLAEWSARKSCRRQQLESLIGSLQHACQVVRPGRAFLRRAIDLLRTPSATKGHHHLRLNREFRADLLWWKTFASHWNGVAMFPAPRQPAFTATSDASGGWGCGGWSNSSWFQLRWPAAARSCHISFKELFAGLIAAAVWGRRWKGSRVQWLCDNQPAVCAVSKRSCRDQDMMHLIRCLFFLEAWFNFELVAGHLPGRENGLADDLSRNHLSFLSKVPSAEPAPAPIPPELLLDQDGWTSPAWTKLFVTIVSAA